MKLASEAVGDPLLGFHVAETFDPRELGLLYYVQASSATLGEAARPYDPANAPRPRR
jgi:hypothetical protein